MVGGCSWLLARCAAVPEWMKTSGKRETGESHFPLFPSLLCIFCSLYIFFSLSYHDLHRSMSLLISPPPSSPLILIFIPLSLSSDDDDHLHFEDDLPLFSPDLAQAFKSHTDCQLAKKSLGHRFCNFGRQPPLGEKKGSTNQGRKE